MFWFIYQDLDNIYETWFMYALGTITVFFAFFWLLIPMFVVWQRRRRRVMKNRKRYGQWLADGGLDNVTLQLAGTGKLALVTSVRAGGKVFFHEKGTLYTDASGEDGPMGHPSDVAFPHFRRKCRVDQRTHCYFTDGAIAFAGRNLEVCIPYADLKSVSVEPGGLVFAVASGETTARMAFTYRNPLIAADVLEFAKEGRWRKMH